MLKSVLGAIGAAALGKIEYLPGLIRRIRPARQVVVGTAHIVQASAILVATGKLHIEGLRPTVIVGGRPVEDQPS
jgi:hypothetical protein